MLLGYLEFVALLFLPGAAFIEIFKLGGEFSFAERLGLAFGLSMAVDVLVLAFRTSGLLIGGQLMVGIFPGTLELMLGAALVAFIAPVALRRKLTFYVQPTRTDLCVLGLVAAQALLVYAHFSKYPIFPEYQSADFLQHVQITADLQAGRLTMFPGGILYYGAHLLMGSLVSLSGDLVLVATQYAMWILTAFSPLLVFVAVNSVTQSRRVGLLASLLYVSTGFVWYGSVFDAGLYANFYGLLSMLLLFGLVPAVLRQPRSPGVWVAFLLALGSGYLSHYSFVTVVPALIALPLAFLFLEKRFSLVSMAVPAIAVLPGVTAAILRPDLVTLLLQFVQAQGGGSITGNTALSQYMAGWPVLRYTVVEITNDLASVVVLVLAAAGTYLAIRGKNPLTWMAVIWLVALLVVAPFSEAAWRFSYMALVPLLIVASVALDKIIPQWSPTMVKRSKMRAKRGTPPYRLALLGVVFLLLVVNSWSWSLVADAATNNGATNQVQHGILVSMQWMNSTLPRPSNIVSVTSFDYNYFFLLFGRGSGYAPLATPDEIAFASNGSATPTYVVLTKIATVTVPPDQNPFSLYPSDSRFQLVYNSSGVFIYKLAP